jgi:hypothetical protein
MPVGTFVSDSQHLLRHHERMTDDAATDHAPEHAPGRGPRIALIILAVVVAVVVVAAIVAVLLRGGATSFDPESPEGVVQRYTQALIDGDLATAQELAATTSEEGCGFSPGGPDDYRVTLMGTTVDDDSAQVRVLVSTTYGQDVFGSGQYQSEEVFRLVKSADAWLIAAAPWQLTVCPEYLP